MQRVRPKNRIHCKHTPGHTGKPYPFMATTSFTKVGSIFLSKLTICLRVTVDDGQPLHAP